MVDSIYSSYLQEKRALTIYLPSNFSTNRAHKVIYATDGQMFTNELYLNMIDSFINSKVLPELIIIGVHSNIHKVPNTNFQFRNCEYVKGLSEDSTTIKRFEDHMNFFVKEVIPYAEKKFLASQNFNDRIFYGCSNGAGFGGTLSSYYPDLIAKYICNSMVGADMTSLDSSLKQLPFFYINYGLDENYWSLMEAKKIIKALESKGLKYSLKYYSGGHDINSWRQEFFADLRKIFYTND